MKRRRRSVVDRSTRRAWIAVALAPVGLVLAVLVSFVGGEGEGAGPSAWGALPGLVALAAPTAALVLALGATRTPDRPARSVVVVAGLVLLAMLVVLPIVAISMTGWVIAAAVVAAVVAFSQRHSHHNPLPSG